MQLTSVLKSQGFDLIGGPVRNHKLLQIWLKKGLNEIDLYYDRIDYAFVSNTPLAEIESPALNVNSSTKDDYGFNIGITVLEETLKSLGLGNLELSAKIKSGKKVTISYDNAVSRNVAVGDIENYLSSADFKHPNPVLLKNANRNNLILATGIIFAKNLVVEIETTFTLDAALVASLNNAADGKLDFSMNSESKLKMVSAGNTFFPIAVKASRIDYDKNVFKKLVLVTDTRNFF